MIRRSHSRILAGGIQLRARFRCPGGLSRQLLLGSSQLAQRLCRLRFELLVLRLQLGVKTGDLALERCLVKLQLLHRHLQLHERLVAVVSVVRPRSGLVERLLSQHCRLF